MDQKYYLLLALMFSVEPVIWIRVMSYLYRPKYKNRLYYVAAIAGMDIIAVLKYLIGFCKGDTILEILGMVIIIVYLLITTVLLFDAKIIQAFVSIGIICVLYVLSDLFSMVIMTGILHVTIIDLNNNGMNYLIGTFIAKVSTLICCEIIIANRKNILRKEAMCSKELIPVIIGNLALSAPSLYVFTNIELLKNQVYLLFIVAMTQIALLLITTLYIVILFEKQSKREMEHRFYIQQMEKELELNKSMIEVTEKLRSLKHDVCSHFVLIKTLLNDGCYDEVKQYVNDLYKDIEIAEEIAVLTNKNVSIILNQKQKLAKQKSIKFDFVIMISDFVISDIEICSLLSNILNNAIEAAEQVELDKRYISLLIRPEKKGYTIECENSLIKKPIQKMDKFITTKQDKRTHGVGIAIMKNIVKSVNGRLRIDYDDNHYIITIFIPT
ncbi:sensor histidine kinase [Anaeromicropila populeti]|uniref:GHKL domain-containing protein n=1 Tax=Anaeromicropila populeti TaxID=37658 RepID=A0A1I6J2N7_9FIRM|nr:sensor histidine kinase [Anaeromicropila populeti]SFR73131.1 GHKL domain-containing protein [Anaeromicropila populeti]